MARNGQASPGQPAIQPAPGGSPLPPAADLPVEAVAPAEAVEPAPSHITYFVGFERRGSSKYGVVSGKLKDGKVFDVVVDPISQDLGETSHVVLAEFQRLVAVIP